MRALVTALLLAASAPAIADTGGDKVDAKALQQSGVKLLEAHDYLGALAIFKDAYARFPSTKILLNIGTTLKLLGRDAEAANVYQRYVDAADADPAKRTEVLGVLAGIDTVVGQVLLTVDPDDAEVQVNDEDWAPAAKQHVVRVAPGQFTIRLRKTGFNSEAKTASLGGGEKMPLAFRMTATPDPTAVTTTRTAGGGMTDYGMNVPPVAAPAPLTRFGAFATAHLDLPHSGGAGFVGVSVDATDMLSLQGAAILGPSYGAFAGAQLAFLHGSLRPTVSAGMPVFFSNGARYGVRGAAGLSIAASRRVSLIVELGVEHILNPEMGIDDTLFIPAVGVGGRL